MRVPKHNISGDDNFSTDSPDPDPEHSSAASSDIDGIPLDVSDTVVHIITTLGMITLDGISLSFDVEDGSLSDIFAKAGFDVIDAEGGR